MAFLGGRLRPGVDIVLDKVDLASRLDGADLIITGEGCMDFQTVYNKAPHRRGEAGRGAKHPRDRRLRLPWAAGSPTSTSTA